MKTKTTKTASLTGVFAAIAALMLTLVPAQSDDKLTVYLDWFVNPDHAPLVIAQTQGYFKQNGLEVELIAPSDPSAPPRLMMLRK